MLLAEDVLLEKLLLRCVVDAEHGDAHAQSPAPLRRLLPGPQLAGEEVEAAFVLVERPGAAVRRPRYRGLLLYDCR